MNVFTFSVLQNMDVNYTDTSKVTDTAYGMISIGWPRDTLSARKWTNVTVTNGQFD